MDEPDPAQVRAAAQGDVDAFTALVRAWQEPVWRFLCHLVGDRTTAEDLTQEVFLRAHRSLGGFRERARFSTWLFAIARNAAIDLHRREVRGGAVLRLVGAAAPAPSPDEDVELRLGLASLSPKLREALVAVEVLGLPYHEAARVLGVPEGTVKSRTFHARRAMVAWLQQTDEEPWSDEV